MLTCSQRAALKSPALTLDINDDSGSTSPQNYSSNCWADYPEPRVILVNRYDLIFFGSLQIIDLVGGFPLHSTEPGNEYQAKAGDTSRSASVCTFVPEINANTELILAGTPLEGCDFLTRQQQFLDRIEQRKVPSIILPLR